MYDELVKKIRRCATDPMHCLSCGEVKDGRCFKRLMTQAANAIEELQRRVPKAPHGRLIDADALLQSHSVSDGIYFPDAYIPATAIKAAPTVIPAEPCNNLSKPCKEDEP